MIFTGQCLVNVHLQSSGQLSLRGSHLTDYIPRIMITITISILDTFSSVALYPSNQSTLHWLSLKKKTIKL